ncbi:hypothetical protein F5Y10DRAFT_268619 [Nemania abortiva]|nr:hypothetical protein F5Y10DRAFT_268619 [Nemania abortiva]
MAYDTEIGRVAFDPDYDLTEEAALANDKASDFCTWIPDFMNQRGNIQYPPSISTWEVVGSGHGEGFGAGAPSPPQAKVQKLTHSIRVRVWDMESLAFKIHNVPVLGIKGIIFDSIQTCYPL